MAALVGVWIAVTRILSEGPKITIVFQSAEGLEAGKTKIHYNGVDIGTVTTIRLSDDHQHVITTAQMAPKTEDFLVEDTKFWVVRPRISGANVTGLGTLISGATSAWRSASRRKNKRDFVALETPPVVTGEVPGPFLRAEDPGPGFARHRHADFLPAPAGRRRSRRTSSTRTARRLTVKVFVQRAVRPVRQPGHALLAGQRDRRVALRERPQRADPVGAVHPDRRYRVRDVPSGRVLPPAEANTVFTLFSDRAEAFEPPPRNPQTYELIFKESVRGLTARRAGRVPRHSDRRGRGYSARKST